MSGAGILALLGAVQGAVLAAALWSRSRSRRSANRWLALLMALVALRLANQLAYSSPRPGSVPVTLRFTVPLLFAFTPLLYLYMRTLVRPREAGRRLDLLHFVPALTALVYTAPFYWTAAQATARDWLSYGQSWRWESTVLNGLIVVQMVWYLTRIWSLLPAYDRRAREVSSNLDAARFRWTRWLVWALLAEVLLVASTVALQVVGAHGPLVEHRGVLLAAFMVLTVYGTGYMALSQPELFVGQPHGEPALKYGRSSLTPSHAEEGARVIRSLLEEKRLYADQDLSLATLSARAGLPPEHVSQIINERMGVSFYELVNNYRIEEAKGRLRDPGSREQKILAVGFEVGFRSKAAFNRLFKLRTGLTPSEFRARQGRTGEADAPR